MSMEGSSDGESFGLFLREVLCPTLKRGQIVVMDNLSVHRGAWVRELIEQKGAEVLLLPPYSPDFNPIEEAFSKVKGLFCGGRRRGREGRSSKPHTGRCLGSRSRTPVASSATACTGRHRRFRYQNRSRYLSLPVVL